MWILVKKCVIILNVYLALISVGHMSSYFLKRIKFVGEVEVVSINIFLCVDLNSEGC